MPTGWYLKEQTANRGIIRYIPQDSRRWYDGTTYVWDKPPKIGGAIRVDLFEDNEQTISTFRMRPFYNASYPNVGDHNYYLKFYVMPWYAIAGRTGSNISARVEAYTRQIGTGFEGTQGRVVWGDDFFPEVLAYVGWQEISPFVDPDDYRNPVAGQVDFYCPPFNIGDLFPGYDVLDFRITLRIESNESAGSGKWMDPCVISNVTLAVDVDETQLSLGSTFRIKESNSVEENLNVIASIPREVMFDETGFLYQSEVDPDVFVRIGETDEGVIYEGLRGKGGTVWFENVDGFIEFHYQDGLKLAHDNGGNPSAVDFDAIFGQLGGFEVPAQYNSTFWHDGEQYERFAPNIRFNNLQRGFGVHTDNFQLSNQAQNTMYDRKGLTVFDGTKQEILVRIGDISGLPYSNTIGDTAWSPATGEVWPDGATGIWIGVANILTFPSNATVQFTRGGPIP